MLLAAIKVVHRLHRNDRLLSLRVSQVSSKRRRRRQPYRSDSMMCCSCWVTCQWGSTSSDRSSSRFKRPLKSWRGHLESRSTQISWRQYSGIIHLSWMISIRAWSGCRKCSRQSIQGVTWSSSWKILLESGWRNRSKEVVRVSRQIRKKSSRR